MAENREDGDQQHPPLRITDAAALTAIGQRLEETDQIRLSGSALRKLSRSVVVAGLSGCDVKALKGGSLAWQHSEGEPSSATGENF